MAVRKIGRSQLLHMMRPRTIIPAGDSITASADVLPAGQYSAGYAPASIFAANGLRMIANAGVAGDDAAELEARFAADVIDKRPDATMMMIGTNNFVSGMASSAYATLFNALERCVLMALDANILPIIVTPPPKNGAAVEAKRAQPFYYWLAEYYGLPLIDVYRMMVNPADGSFISGHSGDGTHPQHAGIAAVFPTVAAGLSDLPSLVGRQYLAAVSESAVGDLANMIRNGSFALGTAPSSITGWTTNVTNSTITLENPTQPETGKVYKNVKAADGGVYALSGSGLTVVPGHELIMSAKVKLSSFVSTTGAFHLGLDGSTTFRPMKGWMQNGTFYPSMKLTVPTGLTAFTPTTYVDVVGTMEISNITVIDRTAMAAIWQPGQQ